MKRSIVSFVALAAFSLGLILVLEPNEISAGGSYKLADAAFAKKLCWAWNSGSLPKKLGSEAAGGSGWIDKDTGVSQVPAGYQKIVSGRADCANWPKFELVIQKDEKGLARCVSGGPYSGSQMTWQFLPSTENWFNYAGNFGMRAFAQLWNNGMKGTYTTAYANRGNFSIFFRQAAWIGLASDYTSGCTGMDKAKVDEAVKELKAAWKMK